MASLTVNIQHEANSSVIYRLQRAVLPLARLTAGRAATEIVGVPATSGVPEFPTAPHAVVVVEILQQLLTRPDILGEETAI